MLRPQRLHPLGVTGLKLFNALLVAREQALDLPGVILMQGFQPGRMLRAQPHDLGGERLAFRNDLFALLVEGTPRAGAGRW